MKDPAELFKHIRIFFICYNPRPDLLSCFFALRRRWLFLVLCSQNVFFNIPQFYASFFDGFLEGNENMESASAHIDEMQYKLICKQKIKRQFAQKDEEYVYMKVQTKKISQYFSGGRVRDSKFT